MWQEPVLVMAYNVAINSSVSGETCTGLCLPIRLAQGRGANTGSLLTKDSND